MSTSRDTGLQNGFEAQRGARPEPADTVVDSAGARVFLDQTATTALDDRVLDAGSSRTVPSASLSASRAEPTPIEARRVLAHSAGPVTLSAGTTSPETRSPGRHRRSARATRLS